MIWRMKPIFDYILGKIYTVSPHGQSVLVVVLAACVLLALISGVLAFFALCIGVFVIAVYADAPRSVPDATGSILSPIDGYVIETVDNQGLPLAFDQNKDQAEHFTRINMRQSFRLCRVVRAPVSGTVKEIVHGSPDGAQKQDGPNWRQMDSVSILITDDAGHETALVINGILVPHQIVLGVQVGVGVAAGDRIGLIRFFGTVDVYVADNAPLAVAQGHTVIAGETALRSNTDTAAPNFRVV
jgi:phosphatidylserine decarboxylase